MLSYFGLIDERMNHSDNNKTCTSVIFIYRHSSIYAVNLGTQKNRGKQKPRKSRLFSSTKGEENRIEL